MSGAAPGERSVEAYVEEIVAPLAARRGARDAALFAPRRQVRAIFEAVSAGLEWRGYLLSTHALVQPRARDDERPLVTRDEIAMLDSGIVGCLEPAVSRAPDILTVEGTVVIAATGSRTVSRAADLSQLQELGFV